MTPKEIFMQAVYRVCGIKSGMLGRRHIPDKKPGEIIASMSEEDRKQLKNLTSNDVKTLDVHDPHIMYFCDEYYEKLEQDKEERALKEKFEREALNKQ